jgi:hypothetical protein
MINKNDVVKTYVPFNIRYVSRIRMPVPSILAYTQSLAAVRSVWCPICTDRNRAREKQQRPE